MTDGGVLSAPAKLPESAALMAAWTNVLTNYVEAVGAATERTTTAPAPYDAQAPIRAMSELVTTLWSDPASFSKRSKRC